MAELSNATYWSETDASNNNASPNGWPEGMMPSGVNDAARADKGALKRFWDRINPVQLIYPAAGWWTFTTSNPSYPTSLINGEIFSFTAQGSSVGGDVFRINTLPQKPIYVVKNAAFVPIGVDDIFYQRVFLVYDTNLASGAGGFVLLNPYLPAWNTGSGNISIKSGLTVGGALTVNGALTAGGSVYAGSGSTTRLFNDGSSAGLIFTGNYGWFQALATGVLSYVNAGGTRVFNIDSGGNVTTGVGGTITTGNGGTIHSGGNVVADGSVITTGDVSARAGVFSYSGGGWALDCSGGSMHVAGSVSVGGLVTCSGGTFSGAVTISAGGTALNLSGGSLNVAGSITTAGIVSTTQGGYFGVGGPVTIAAGGTALDVSGGSAHVAGSINVGGDVNCLDITASVQGYKPGGGAWAAISDVRTKDADTVADYTTGLPEIMRLRPITYQHNGRGGTHRDGRTFVGLVADDVLSVMPEMIGTIEAKLDPDDENPTEMLTLEATALIFALCNSVRTLAAEIAALKEK